MDNIVQLFRTIDLNDVDQMASLIDKAGAAAGVGAVPPGMGRWVASEYKARHERAIAAFKAAVVGGFDWAVPTGGDPEEVAKMNSAIEEHIHAVAAEMNKAHSDELFQAVIDLYLAKHPLPLPPGGGLRRAA